MRDRADRGRRLRVIHVQNRHVLASVTTWLNAATTEDQAGVVHSRQRHRETGAVLVAMVQPDHRVVAVSRHDALGRIRDQVSRNKTRPAAFQTLCQVVTHGRCSERKAKHPSRTAAFRHSAAQLVSVLVAQVPFEQRNADSHLRLVEVGLGHSEAVEERRHSPLPSMGQLSAIPIQNGHVSRFL